MSKQIINIPLQINKVAKGNLTDSILVRGKDDNEIKEITIKSLNAFSEKEWYYHIPLTSSSSNLFFANLSSGGSYPINSSIVKVNYFQLTSDSPYGTDLRINSFESNVRLFDNESLSAELVYDSTNNEYYNDTSWRVAIGQTGIDTDFIGFDFCLSGTIQIATQSNFKETRVNTNILFQKDTIYLFIITKKEKGYNMNLVNKKTNEIIFNYTFDKNVSELSGFSIFPYNTKSSNPSGLFKMGVIRLGYCPSK